MASRFNGEEFAQFMREKYNGMYEYLGYEKGLVKFLCKKHNEIGYGTPTRIRSGRTCKLCSKERQGAYNAAANELARRTFVDKARAKHGDKYDYSKVEYIKSNIKVDIICPIHGIFHMTPNSHLRGCGCRKCSDEKTHAKQRKTTEQFIREAVEVHENKYDYSKVEYIGRKKKVTIVCPEHGEFFQAPEKHLIGEGCPKCAIKGKSMRFSMTTEEFIEKSKRLHGDKYDYSKTVYNGYDNRLTIICPIHGEFQQTPDSHLQGSGCQKCSSRLSKAENEIYEFIEGIVGAGNVEKSNTSVLEGHSEIDIFIPSMNIGIEYNGCRWHSELFKKDSKCHLKKTVECERKGVSLIQIFEDEYKCKKEIVLSKLRHILKRDEYPRICGRKCKVSEITYTDASKFLETNHIQGSQRATVYLGATYNGELVGVMTFIRTKDGEFELNRFASSIGHVCQGVGGKLFSFFVRNYSPVKIKSFADRRWTTNTQRNIYTALGFSLETTIGPDYRYVIDGTYKRLHKFNFRKTTLRKKYGFDLSMTESEMADKLNAYRIWDCGLYKYVWYNEQYK